MKTGNVRELTQVGVADTVSGAMADEALGLVNGARQGQYGTPERSLESIADVWTGILKKKLPDGARVTAEDVALLLCGMKLAREANAPKRDNVVDAHGYLLMLGSLPAYR